ncbi:hypothetical protein GVX82_04835 [Patescibacteria group bacterium]|nr:hypothetical protein [Patescibacteria group bacterium]
MQIYVGCALRNAPNAFKDEVEEMKDALEAGGHELLRFVGEDDTPSRDVFEHDIACVQACDVMLAVVTEPSLGLGMELMEALHLSKRIIVLAEEGAHLSKMVLGAAEVGGHAMVWYQTGGLTGAALHALN